MSSRFLILPFVFAFAASTAQAEETPQWCDIPFPNSVASQGCGSNEYLSVGLDGSSLSGNENPCTLIKSCQPAHKPPSQVKLSCTASGNSFLCDAWPRGKTAGEFSYDWFATGPVAVDMSGPTESPQQVVDCSGAGGGFVSVVVTSPFGLSSTEFVAVNCGS